MILVRPIRQEQEEQFRLIAERMAALSDDELRELHTRWYERVCDMLREARFAGESAWDQPTSKVEMAMADLLNEESNHRRGVIWWAEADMRGGHYVHVGYGDDPAKFNAYCLPYDEMCWEGADRDTIEQAVQDGRNHNPGHEPELRPWLQDEND